MPKVTKNKLTLFASDCQTRSIDFLHVVGMQFWHFLVHFHLLCVCKFATAGGTNVDSGLYLHFSFPLFSQLLSCPALALFFIHFLRNNGLLLLFQLLLTLFFELLHRYRRSCFLFFYFSLSLTMIVVVFLLRPFLGSFFPLSGFIGHRLKVVVIRFVSWIHDCDPLAGYSKASLICLFVSLSSLFWWEELNECEIFELACEFVPNLPNVPHRDYCLEDFQQNILFYIANNRAPDHQAAILCRFFFEVARRRLCAIAQSTVNWFLWLTSIALVSSCEVFIVTFVTVPIISKRKIHFPHWIVL